MTEALGSQNIVNIKAHSNKNYQYKFTTLLPLINKSKCFHQSYLPGLLLFQHKICHQTACSRSRSTVFHN